MKAAWSSIGLDEFALLIRKTCADSCLLPMCYRRCWLCVRGEMYMTGLTEFIDVKQLDGNADVVSPWLDPRIFFQQQYTHTCTRNYAAYFDIIKHTPRKRKQATPLYTLATFTPPIHKPLTINSTTVSHRKESNVSRDGWFRLFHWGSGLGRYQPCGHFGQRLTTTGPSLEWTGWPHRKCI